MILPGDLIRVFPRRTKATPTDRLAFVGDPPLPAFRPARNAIAAVHVSCAFTWDMPEARRLMRPHSLWAASNATAEEAAR